MSIELMDFLHNPDGRTDVGRSRDAIASKKLYGCGWINPLQTLRVLS